MNEVGRGMEGRTARCPKCGDSEVVYGVFRYQGTEYPPTPPACPACAEKLGRENDRLQIEEDRAAHSSAVGARAASILELLERAGANPWEHGRATLDTYDVSESGSTPISAARSFLEDVEKADKYDPVEGLFFFGLTGAGKSHLAIGILRELLLDPTHKPADILFDQAAALLTEIQDCYKTGGVREAKARRISAEVWILDDLGTERPSDDAARVLCEIFALRALRPTVITSNLAPHELTERHPEFNRLVSRLGPQYFRAVQVTGRDRRFDRD